MVHLEPFVITSNSGITLILREEMMQLQAENLLFFSRFWVITSSLKNDAEVNFDTFEVSNFDNLRHRTSASSSPVVQSLNESHIQSVGIHRPSLHGNCVFEQPEMKKEKKY